MARKSQPGCDPACHGFSPRAALVYSTDFDATFKLMYGEAFRAPSLRQSGSTEVGNPDLQPEAVKTIEFAYIQAFNKLQTGITYFHSEYQDKITTVPRPTGPGRIFDNTGDSTAYGFELDAIAQIENLTLRAAYTNLLKTEPAPRFVAKRTFSLIANYRLNRWNFNLNGYYHDNMQQNAIVPGVGRTTVTLDDYWVWNLTTRYGLTAFLGIEMQF